MVSEFVSTNTVRSTQCHYHPERDGVGICMKCNKVICTECSTRIDGINHCAACVAGLVRDRKESSVVDNVKLKSVGIVGMSCVVALGVYAIMHMLFLW